MVRKSPKVVPPYWLAIRGQEYIDAFHKACAGNELEASSLFDSFEYANQLRLVREFWELKQVGKITGGVWSAVLSLAWTVGRRGSILTDALSKLNRGELAKMFLEADKRVLMDDIGLARFESLPDNFIVYRGCGRFARHRTNGISWTTNREQAEWFALRTPTPMLLEAQMPRAAVMATFKYEWEVLKNPLVRVKKTNDVDLWMPPEARFVRMEGLGKKLRTAAQRQKKLPKVVAVQ